MPDIASFYESAGTGYGLAAESVLNSFIPCERILAQFLPIAAAKSVEPGRGWLSFASEPGRSSPCGHG
jgi:hypothetical protein